MKQRRNRNIAGPRKKKKKRREERLGKDAQMFTSVGHIRLSYS